MTARWGTVALCALLLIDSPARGQSPTFRSNADLVPVYVSVRNGRTPVGNLAAADFELTDRGVPQTVSAAIYESLPIDVTLLVDTSASVITSLARFRSDVSTIVASLRPEEQIRLITFDTDVRQLLPMQAPSSRPPVREIRLGDRTSLIDAVTFAMARARRPDRRHLIFVFTDGYDTSSMLDYRALPELASRIDGLLHVVLVQAGDTLDAGSQTKLNILAAAATRTGGALYPSALSSRDIVRAFNDAIEAFRHSYVVYFAPTDVDRAGWHDIAVRVKRQDAYVVRAREGYFSR
jgi:VWFA-related protein